MKFKTAKFQSNHAIFLSINILLWAIRATMNIFNRYEIEKRNWVNVNPDATPAQIERAFQAIARRLGI